MFVFTNVVRYSLVALSFEFKDSIPPFILNWENVNGVDNAIDSEYVNWEVVVAAAIDILDVLDCVIGPAVCVHVYAESVGIVNTNDVDVMLTDPAPVLLNEMAFICKFDVDVDVADIILGVVPENSRLSIVVAPNPDDVKLPSSNNLTPGDVTVKVDPVIATNPFIRVLFSSVYVPPPLIDMKSEFVLNPDSVSVPTVKLELVLFNALNWPPASTV